MLLRIDKNNITIRYSEKYASFVKEAGGKDYVPWAWPENPKSNKRPSLRLVGGKQ